MLLSINIITDYPLWFSIFCVLLGAIYAFVLYRKEEKFNEIAPWLIKLMASFRFLLVTILAFLLLSPFIKTLFNKVEKPVIVIAQDNSSSILLNKDSAFYQTEYLEKLKNLKASLEEKYEVKTYTFGQNLEEGDKIDFSKKVTDLSNVFDEISNKYYNRNVGALILASDGIFNQGSNPVFNSGIEFPIYTIALGDTSIQKDIILKEAIHNKITFLGNQFPIEIAAEALQCVGNETRLTVTHNGKKLFAKEYKLNTERFVMNENVLFEAEKVGVQHYQISLSTIEGEVSTINNVKDIYIEVLDGRQNILILANAPHPDVKALKLSIENNENYKVTNQLMSDFDGNTEAYSLVVVHQLPSNISPTLKKALESDVSVLYFLGNQSNIGKYNSLNIGLNIAKSGNRFNEILPAFTNNFPLFTLSENTIKSINTMPPVVGPFGDYQLKTNGYVLLNQKIGSVETDSPLMVFFQDNGKKSAILAAEGIWKWRMQDFLKNKNHDAFNELINKTVQFLSVKEDKSKFRIITKNNYFENEIIQFNGELYNDSYELVNDPEITLELFEDAGDKYDFVFNRTSTSYILNAGILPAGFYNYKAKVKFGTKDYTETGKFQIKQLLLEANNTIANHQLLQNIAEKFGGKLFYPTQTGALAKAINENTDITSIIYEENDLKELISLKWIFFVLLALLSVEWFLRKRNGAY
ncbi:MAG: hypothetical protein COB15_00660 [Flavobacteriales bacterium]|nr:MAG: hypothetical protein COB15_00660 [Flavobacteriales bacterium]